MNWPLLFCSLPATSGAGSPRNTQIGRGMLGNMEFGPFVLEGAWLRGLQAPGETQPSVCPHRMWLWAKVERQGWEQQPDKLRWQSLAPGTGALFVGDQPCKARHH